MQVYLHSDDLGATPHSTARILQAWREGYLDGFSILANGDALPQVEEAIRAEPERAARIAVHLNLTEGSALTGELTGLTRHGHFSKGFIGLWAASRRAAVRQAVEAEWEAQILRVKECVAPRALASIDGHQHVHMIPVLFEIACRLASKHGIPSVRVSREPLHSLPLPRPANVLKHALLNALSRDAVHRAASEGLDHVDFVLGVLHSGRMTVTAMEAGVAAARGRSAGRMEIITHVGRATPEEAQRWRQRKAIGVFYLSPDRDTEFEHAKLWRQRHARMDASAPQT